jgi:hypothetical protein
MLAARGRIHGASPAHAALAANPAAMQDRLRNVALAALTEGALWLERIELDTTPPTGPAPPDPDAEPLLHLLTALPADPAIAQLAAWARELLNKAPGLRDTLADDHPAIALDRGDMPESLLAQAHALLRARLAGG